MTPMRLNLPILVGALGTALLCAYLGYYVPAAVLFIVNTVAVIAGWLPPYFVLLCLTLAAMVAFNIWAAKGSG